MKKVRTFVVQHAFHASTAHGTREDRCVSVATPLLYLRTPIYVTIFSTYDLKNDTHDILRSFVELDILKGARASERAASLQTRAASPRAGVTPGTSHLSAFCACAGAHNMMTVASSRRIGPRPLLCFLLTLQHSHESKE